MYTMWLVKCILNTYMDTTLCILFGQQVGVESNTCRVIRCVRFATAGIVNSSLYSTMYSDGLSPVCGSGTWVMRIDNKELEYHHFIYIYIYYTATSEKCRELDICTIKCRPVYIYKYTLTTPNRNLKSFLRHIFRLKCHQTNYGAPNIYTHYSDRLLHIIKGSTKWPSKQPILLLSNIRYTQQAF